MIRVMLKGILHLLFLPLVTSQVFPTEYTFPIPTSMKGSSTTGNCPNVTTDSPGMITCTDPTSGVLYDNPGGMPTLTGLDGDMWASQLLTIQTTASSTEITFDFRNTPDFFGVERVEVVMFNCPQWGLGVNTIRLLEQGTPIGTANPLTSCDSLVRACIQARSTITVHDLEFILHPDSDWVHLAEVTFYGNPTCRPDIIFPTPPPPTTPETTTAITSDGPDEDTYTSANQDDITPPFTQTQCEVCPSCSTSTLLASVITAITTALLATVIFVLVLIAVCKCHPKFTPGGAETGTSAGEGEGQEYEQVDVGEGGVAVSDPTYMEVGEGGNTFELKQNEAYAMHSKDGRRSPHL